MEHISIKDHPPWYARGTPVSNTRDGPAMALNNKLLFAICRGPSARGEPGGKTRRWLTLKKSILVDADFVVDADRSGDAVRSVGNFDLSACAAFRFIGTSSDNVKNAKYDNVVENNIGIINAVKSKYVDRLKNVDSLNRLKWKTTN